jgi:hypothetical protein
LSFSNRFSTTDRDTRAARVARVMASDLLTYHPERVAQARGEGTLVETFRRELQEAWDEFVVRFGEEFASESHAFAEGLNQILSPEERVFQGPGCPF